MGPSPVMVASLHRSPSTSVALTSPVVAETAAALSKRMSSGLRSGRTKTSKAVTLRDARTFGPIGRIERRGAFANEHLSRGHQSV